MKKYPSLKYPDDKESNGLIAEGQIFVQEKLDGANFRFTLEQNLDDQYHTDDREIAFGSRNVQFKNAEDENKQFAEPMKYIRENVHGSSLEEVETEIGGPATFFGEAMLPHTLTYNFENIPEFVGFDIWNHDKEQFVEPRLCKELFESTLDLDFAPILDEVPVNEWDEYAVNVPESVYGEVKAEGMVLKNPTTRVYSKIVRQDFKEKASGGSGPNSRSASEKGAEKLLYQYITNARIEKNAHKLVDEGPWDSLKMEMMAPTDGHDGLPQAVIRDMAEEEAANIFLTESYEVDIGEFRSLTSSRCAKVLRKMINEKHFSQ